MRNSTMQLLFWGLCIAHFAVNVITVTAVIAIGIKLVRRVDKSLTIAEAYLEITKQYQAATVRQGIETSRTVGKMSDEVADKVASKAAEVVKETAKNLPLVVPKHSE